MEGGCVVKKVHARNRQLQAWERMLKALSEYSVTFGNCNVPADFDRNPSLGRWVSAQRHKKKVGELSTSRVKDLEELGFIWCPADKNWEQMFRLLCEFKEKHQNCDVPTSVESHKVLSRWVHKQRLRCRNGDISQAQKERLDEIGFSWTSNGRDEKNPVPMGEKANGNRKINGDALFTKFSEKLYSLGNGVWVQHDGNGQKSDTLEAYIAAHGGQEPPFIPLPTHPVEFHFGPVEIDSMKLQWEGSGPLPSLVMEFVRENGTLPRHAY